MTSRLTLNQATPYIGILLKVHLEQNPESKIRDRKNVFSSFCDHFAHLRVTEVTPVKIKNWLLALQKQNGYSDRNLHAIKPLLNHFFKFLVQEGHLVSNPLDQVRFNRRSPPTRNRVVLSEQEVNEMLEALFKMSPAVIYPFIFTLTHTGCRRDEVRCLKWDDVDFETGLVHIRFSKNGNSRSIRMSSKLHKVLLSLPRIKEWVFLNQFGRQLSATQIDDAIIRLQKTYPEMKRWRCHDLRHSFAYNFLKQGGQMYQLQAVLGHKSIDLYGQLQAADVERVSPY